jgi:hypothetical protein
VFVFSKRKEVKTMKYETPEVTMLSPAINAIQHMGPNKVLEPIADSGLRESPAAYADWE